MKTKIFEEALNKYTQERQKSCNHSFVDGYDVVKGEAYKRCGFCGIEINRRPMSEEDAINYLGILDKMSAKGEKKRVGEQLNLNLEGSNGKKA